MGRRCRAKRAFQAGSAARWSRRRKRPRARTVRSRGRHSPSSRLTRLTAGPMAVKSSRSAAPMLPHNISPRCRATPNGKGGSPSRTRASSRWAIPLRAAATVLSAASQALRGDPPATGKIASTPSPMNLSTSPPNACTEPAMRSNQASRAAMTSEGGLLSESAVKPLRSANRSAASIVSPIPRRKRTSQHARGAAPAEIGLERRHQRGARGQRGERRRREARSLAQAFGLIGDEGTRSDPSEPWPVRGQPNKVFMHWAARKPCKPAPAVAGRTIRSHRGMRSGHEFPKPRPPDCYRLARARCAGRSAGGAKPE